MPGHRATDPNDRRRRRGPRPELTGLRPQVWVTGPDPRRHAQYKAWGLHRAQANFRDEEHDLSFEDFEAAWNKHDAWAQRGRQIDSLCMVRIDIELPWRKDNITIIARRDQLLYHNAQKIGTTYKRRSDAGKPRKPRD